MPRTTDLDLFDLEAPASATAVARVTGATRQRIQELLSAGRLGRPKTNADLLWGYTAYLRARCMSAGVNPDDFKPIAH